MERILLEGLDDDQIRQFMHVLDVMQTNLVKTGLIGDESRYPSLEIQEQDASKSQVPQESQVPQKTCDDYASNNRDARDEYVLSLIHIYCTIVDSEANRIVEPGEFEVLIGHSSRREHLKRTTFTVA